MLKHYVHCHQSFDLLKGGSVGYISSLFQGFTENNPLFQIQEDLQCCFLFPNIATHERLENEDLGLVLDARLQYTQCNNEISTKTSLDLLEKRQRLFREILPITEYSKLDPKHISSIHIHGAYNFFPVYNSLTKMGIESRVVKILTTHNPYQPTMEDVYLLNRARPLDENTNKLMSYYFNERDKWAFKLADCLFFPSKESLEGYYSLWSDFESLIKDKPIYFCPTGTTIKKPILSQENLKSHLNIPIDAKMILYIGRFIDVRGYDILIEAAQTILNTRNDIYFVVVGEKQISPITHKQWIQIPFVDNPSDYINAADVCVCPNRGSLFDLSMIEILSLGTPIICSYVGGYKWLENKTSGVLYALAGNKDSLISKIYEFMDLTQEKLSKMSHDNKMLYNNELSLKCFQHNYCETIKEIYKDFKISNKQYMISYCETNLLCNALFQNKTMLASDKKIIGKTKLQRKIDKLKNDPMLFIKDFFRKRFKR